MERYVAAGRSPWSDGYTKFKNQLLAEVLADDAMTIEPDGAAAARAVCCLELIRPA